MSRNVRYGLKVVLPVLIAWPFTEACKMLSYRGVCSVEATVAKCTHTTRTHWELQKQYL